MKPRDSIKKQAKIPGKRELVRFGCQFRKGNRLATKKKGKMKLFGLEAIENFDLAYSDLVGIVIVR